MFGRGILIALILQIDSSLADKDAKDSLRRLERYRATLVAPLAMKLNYSIPGLIAKETRDSWGESRDAWTH